MTKSFAAMLLGFYLVSCDRPRTQADCQSTFKPVLDSQVVRGESSLEVRYAFGANKMDSEIYRLGLEGSGPFNLIMSTGAGARQMAHRSVAKLMDGGSRPTIVHVSGGDRAALVYSPARLFTPKDARLHLRKMCALSARGLELTTYRVVNRLAPPRA